MSVTFSSFPMRNEQKVGRLRTYGQGMSGRSRRVGMSDEVEYL